MEIGGIWYYHWKVESNLRSPLTQFIGKEHTGKHSFPITLLLSTNSAKTDGAVGTKLKPGWNTTKWPLPPWCVVASRPLLALSGRSAAWGWGCGWGYGVGGVGGAFSRLIRGAEKGDRLSDRQAARTQLWRPVSAQWQPYDELPLPDDSAVTQWYRRRDCSVCVSRSPPLANEEVKWNLPLPSCFVIFH